MAVGGLTKCISHESSDNGTLPSVYEDEMKYATKVLFIVPCLSRHLHSTDTIFGLILKRDPKTVRRCRLRVELGRGIKFEALSLDESRDV